MVIVFGFHLLAGVARFGLVFNQRLFYSWILIPLVLLDGVTTHRMLVVKFVMGIECVIIHYTFGDAVVSRTGWKESNHSERCSRNSRSRPNYPSNSPH